MKVIYVPDDSVETDFHNCSRELRIEHERNKSVDDFL